MTAISENPNTDIADTVSTDGLVGPAYRLTGEMRLAEGQVPTASKLRTVIALLVANAGNPVSTEALIEELWASKPPRSATSTVHTYVLKLRKFLGDESVRGAYKLLESRPGGYRFNVPSHDVDVLAFAGASKGLTPLPAHDERRLLRTLASLEACLELVDAYALEDTACGSRLQVVKNLHTTRYQAVVLYRIQALIMLGRHQEVLPELEELCLKAPLHEQAAQWRMLALYRSGLPAVALQAFRMLRHAMHEELGMDPGPQSRELQRMILSQDPRLRQGVSYMF